MPREVAYGDVEDILSDLYWVCGRINGTMHENRCIVPDLEHIPKKVHHAIGILEQYRDPKIYWVEECVYSEEEGGSENPKPGTQEFDDCRDDHIYHKRSEE